MTSADALTRMGQLICRWLPKYQSVLFCFRMSRCVYIVHVQALKTHAILKCAPKKNLHFSACSRCVSSMSSVDRWATSQVPPLQIFVGVDMGWLQAVELPKTGQLSCFGRALRWESWKSWEVGLTKVCEGLHILEIARTFVMLHMLPFQSHFALNLESGSRWCSFQALLKMVLDGFVHLGFQRWGAICSWCSTSKIILDVAQKNTVPHVELVKALSTWAKCSSPKTTSHKITEAETSATVPLQK